MLRAFDNLYVSGETSIIIASVAQLWSVKATATDENSNFQSIIQQMQQ